MQVSARILGKDYGLTAEEMNRVLHKLGFLEGKPGDYSLTEKALQYGAEKNWHRGNGGYSQYNRYWTTRTFDDSIKKVLDSDISADLIKEVRAQSSAARVARYAELAKQSAAKDVAMAGEAAQKTSVPALGHIKKLTKGEKTVIIILGTIVVGYSIYKVVPRVKSWNNNRKKTRKSQQTADKD